MKKNVWDSNEKLEVINIGDPINIESKNTTIKVTAPAIAFTEDGVYKVTVKNNKVTVTKEG